MIKQLILTIGILAAIMPGASADPVRIRLSYIVPVSNWATILFAKPELAKHLGTSYAFEPILFQGTPMQIQAQAVGELEIANYGYTSFPIAILNAGLGDLRIIADEFQDGVADWYSDEFMVLKDSPIHTVEDLKGKVIGTNLKGSGVDIAMRAMLRKHHLDETKDVTIIEAATSTQPAMLMGHKVDIIPGVLPFSMDATVRDAARALFLQRDAMGITQMGMWVARAGFIEKNRAALVDFMEDALRAERWYLDPANHDEAVAIAVKVTKAPPERWQSWLFEKHGDYYRDPNGIPNLDALQSNIETVRDLGFIKSSIEVKKYVDLSLVEEATRRLK